MNAMPEHLCDLMNLQLQCLLSIIFMSGITMAFLDFVSTNRLNKNGIRITLRSQKVEHDTSTSISVIRG